MATTYEDAVALIDEAEAEERDIPIVTINFNDATALHVKEIPHSEAEAEEFIAFADKLVPPSVGAVQVTGPEEVKQSGLSGILKSIEKGHKVPKGRKKGKAQQPAPAQQAKQPQPAPQPQPQPPTLGPASQPANVQAVSQPAVRQQVQNPKPSEPVVTESDIKAAADEMRNINKAQKAPSKPITEEYEAGNNEELVLPKLSLADQISELESINAGIESNVFDSEQIDIVRKEVAGLSEALGRKPAENDPQKDLISLRNERLRMAIKKLGLGQQG